MNDSRHAYLIIAHRNICQLEKLLKMLDHERNDIYLHVDKSSSIDLTTVGRELKYSKIYKYKELRVYWSDYSLTETELFLLERACENGPYLFYHLLSGSDLPIKSQAYILSFFDSNKGKEFVEYQKGSCMKEPYYDRIKYYHVLSKYYRMPGKVGKIISYVAVGIEYFCIFLQWLFCVNRLPAGMDFARGSQWFDITDSLAQFVLSKKDWIRKQFKYTRASDESFLPYIVHNSEFENNLFYSGLDGGMKANMRYIDWSDGDPHIFTIRDMDKLLASEMLFARKFDENIDSRVISVIFSLFSKR